MKRSIIVLSLIFSLILTSLVSISCGGTPEEPFAIDVALESYVNEIMHEGNLTLDRLNESAALLQAGKITPKDFRFRQYEATVIEAYTIQYIDSKPDYEQLLPLIYGDTVPSKLGWCIPELQSNPDEAQAQCESYFSDWVTAHYIAIDIFMEKMP